MAQDICAICRFYNPKGDGTGYCSLLDKKVKHNGKCSEYEEK